MAGILDFLGDNSDALISAGAGLLGSPNWSQGLANGLVGFQQGSQIDHQRALQAQAEAEKKQREAAMSQWLATQNLTPQQRAMAQTNPELAGSLFASSLTPKKRDLREIGGSLYDVDAGKVVFTAPKGEGALPSEIQEYNMALSQGFKGGLLDYQRAKKGSSADKLTPGWRWKAGMEGQEMEPIPGGPATQIPVEAAARLGLAQSFMKKAPQVRKEIEEGALDGYGGTAGLATGVGKPGQIYQEIQSGRDALLRNLTGAGMGVQEAKEYADRYLPSPYDSKERILEKLDRLTDEIQSTSQMIGQGRGGSPIPGAPASTANSDPLGIR